MTIADVDFGRLDAENEEHLQEYFVDTGVLSRLLSGKKHYVIGRKGAGKTALFRCLTPDSAGHDVLPLEFKDYSWDAHKTLREEGVLEEAAYTGSWRFTLLMALVTRWAEAGKGTAAKGAKKILTDIYGNDHPSWHQVLFDKLRRVRKLTLPSIPGVADLGGVEFDGGNSPLVAASLSRWSAHLLDFAKASYQASPISLLLDRLDEGWDASPASRALLAGALKAAREINLELSAKGTLSPVVVFLRTDILHLLQFNDKNKMGLDTEQLEWNYPQLADVVAARIARSLGIERPAAWDAVFSEDKMRQSASIQTYILKRTMMRPRDAIAFASLCQEVAIAHSHDVVETDDVYEADRRYSKHVYDELDDEMHKQLPRARQSLQVLRDVRQLRFTFENWMTALRARVPDATAAEGQERLRELFDYSIVGVEKKGGKVGGTEFSFIYSDRFLEPEFNAQMVVHSALKQALGLKDKGA